MSQSLASPQALSEHQLWEQFVKLCDRFLFVCYLIIFTIFFMLNIVTLWTNSYLSR